MGVGDEHCPNLCNQLTEECYCDIQCWYCGRINYKEYAKDTRGRCLNCNYSYNCSNEVKQKELLKRGEKKDG